MSKFVTLEQITSKIGSGATPKGGSESYFTTGVTFIRSQNVQDMSFSNHGLVYLNDQQANNLKGATVLADDILLNITGDSIARSCVVPNSILPARVNQHVSILRCTDKNDAAYVGFYIQYLKSYLLQICKVGGTRNALTKEAISNLKIHFPEDRQQRSVLLSTINKKIEINNRINTELESIAKTLYDYWFIQFDFPDVSGKPYKTNGGKLVYNPILKREIPEGWEVNTIADWIANDKNGDWGKEQPEGNYSLKVDCIRGTDINGINGNDLLEPPTRFILDKNKFKLLNPYDLIIEISGGSPTQSTGRMAYITEASLERFNNPIVCSNFCKAISLKDNAYFFNFAYQWASIYRQGILFGWEGKTSGIKNLLFEAFTSKYYVTKPPSTLANRFFETASKIEKQKQSLLKQNSDLTRLRDWLLPMLMNGQVTIKC